jgi:hypothetical protein
MTIVPAPRSCLVAVVFVSMASALLALAIGERLVRGRLMK